MAELATPLPHTSAPDSIRVPRSADAPGRARRYVLELLRGAVDASTASDAALLVSELVTNSVIHADAARNREVSIELTRLDDRIRLAVTDAGSSFAPRLLPVDPTTPRGFGLRLIDDLCHAWGVLRHGDGMTSVWCELLLDPGVRS
jgi:anti-sigma regulatory factor (Ser/Thr protein kinase)